MWHRAASPPEVEYLVDLASPRRDIGAVGAGGRPLLCVFAKHLLFLAVYPRRQALPVPQTKDTARSPSRASRSRSTITPPSSYMYGPTPLDYAHIVFRLGFDAGPKCEIGEILGLYIWSADQEVTSATGMGGHEWGRLENHS
ncbi:hypothetical protein K523DRAFT_358622 [Schizophyllum commune Tattone D]|nr:hypothetical protein K523DRAFT_358622 [Schizophyllum commune Tattone D]